MSDELNSELQSIDLIVEDWSKHAGRLAPFTSPPPDIQRLLLRAIEIESELSRERQLTESKKHTFQIVMPGTNKPTEAK